MENIVQPMHVPNRLNTVPLVKSQNTPTSAYFSQISQNTAQQYLEEKAWESFTAK